MNRTNIFDLRIASFNCYGLMNKLPVIGDMCKNVDILLLQETWLLPMDLRILDNLDDDFLAFSISSVNICEKFIGRPYGGLSFLWRKSLGNSCKIIDFDDKRILGLEVTSSATELLLINVYLPYYSQENIDEYMLGKSLQF